MVLTMHAALVAASFAVWPLFVVLVTAVSPAEAEREPEPELQDDRQVDGYRLAA
jgi:hypothetical protein